MPKKQPKATSSPPPEHRWDCKVEGCNYRVTFTTEQSDAALDTIASHKSSHLLEQPPATEPLSQPPSIPSSSLDAALAALIRSQSQTQQLLGTIAQSNQANAEAIGQLAASLAQLNQMILDSRRPEADGQAVAQPQGGQKASWGPVEIAQIASALGIGKSSNPMDGLTQFRAMLDGLQPILNWHEGAMLRGFGMATDTFTRSVRAGMTPEQAAAGMEQTVKEGMTRLQPQAQPP